MSDDRPPARDAERRKRDVLDRLERDVDAWVGTAGADGTPYLTPLSFLWDGEQIVVATPRTSPTGRNLARGSARLGIGETRDVVLIEGTVTVRPAGEVGADLAEAFAAKAGFDPRTQPESYAYYAITPRRISAWREVNELAGRVLMRDGRWLV